MRQPFVSPAPLTSSRADPGVSRILAPVTGWHGKEFWRTFPTRGQAGRRRLSKNSAMNSHILSGAIGAILALAGSTAVDNLKCDKIEAGNIALAFAEKSVSIGHASIELRDSQSGARCLLTSDGIMFSRGGLKPSEGGAAWLRVSPEMGATLDLVQKEAMVSLKAFGGQKPEASLLARFFEDGNGAAVSASPDGALLLVHDRGKTSAMDGSGCSANIEASLDALEQDALHSSVDGPPAQTVFVTRTGDKYHLAGCQYLRTSMISME